MAVNLLLFTSPT